MTEQKIETYKEKQERLKAEREIIIQKEKEMAIAKMDGFKADLAELLKKHNAILGMSISGDTHGIYDEKLTVAFVLSEKDGYNKSTISPDVTLIDDTSIRYSDLMDQK